MPTSKQTQKDVLSRLTATGEEAMKKVAEMPAGARMLEAVNGVRDRVDELTKRMRSLDPLEKRVAELERRLDELAPAPKRSATSRSSTAKKAKAPAKKRTPNAAFMKALTPSPQLAAVVGSAPLPRTEVVSKLWAYIKKNKLQDSVNKRMVNADAKLKEIFGKAQVSMFEMAGLIGKHVK